MKDYSIEEGIFYNDLDCPYDEENNKIDVYASVMWSASSEAEYEAKEGIIIGWKYEDDLIRAGAWCDSSGYEYWIVQQEEEGNYVSIDVYLKKPADQYTQKEIEQISNLISKWDDYFLDKLS